MRDAGREFLGGNDEDKTFENCSSRRHKRGEVFCVVAFAVATLFVPLLATELYPFSAASMFAHSPKTYTVYRVTGPTGETWDSHLLGVGLNNPHDPPLDSWGRRGYGRRFPESPAGYDVEWNERLLEERVQPFLQKHAQAFAEVEGLRYGVQDGVVTCLERRSFRIRNERFYPGR